MGGQQGDVFRAFTQWRNPELHYVEAVVKVFPEQALLDLAEAFSPVYVIGFSVGGLIAMALALGTSPRSLTAGEQAVIDISVRLSDTPTNVAGLVFVNTAAYTYNLTDNDAATERLGDPGTSGPTTVVEPALTLEKGGPINMRVGVPETFTLNVHNIGDSPAWNTTRTDVLPNQADGGMCDAPPTNVTAQVYEADGTTPVSAALVDGTDYTVTFDGDPNCTLTFNFLTPDAALGADQRLIVTYDAALDAGLDRTSFMVALGGGVVGDLAGLDRFLDHARRLVAPEGQILVDSSDLRRSPDPATAPVSRTTARVVSTWIFSGRRSASTTDRSGCARTPKRASAGK